LHTHVGGQVCMRLPVPRLRSEIHNAAHAVHHPNKSDLSKMLIRTRQLASDPPLTHDPVQSCVYSKPPIPLCSLFPSQHSRRILHLVASICCVFVSRSAGVFAKFPIFPSSHFFLICAIPFNPFLLLICVLTFHDPVRLRWSNVEARNY
jgi:hypothetical protein